MQTTSYTPERADFLAGIIVTAVEGGCLQFDFKNYDFKDAPGEECAALCDAYCDARDIERQYPADWKHVGLLEIDAALAEFRKPGAALALGVHPSYVQTIIGQDATNDGTMIDAELSDMIMQVALIGKVIFG